MSEEPLAVPGSQEDAKLTEDAQFQALIRQVREGSEDATWQLVESYESSVRRTVRRALNKRLRSKFDSMDFVQLVWTSFFKFPEKLDRFERPTDLAAFLIVMAQNKVRMETRRHVYTEKRNIFRDSPLVEGEVAKSADTSSHPPEPEPIDVAIAREQWENLLRSQPEHYRQIIRMKLQGRSQKEIADTLNLDVATVRRFLKKLSRRAL